MYAIYMIDEAPDLTLCEAANILRIEKSALDRQFGVQLIEPCSGMYAVRVYGEVPEPYDRRVRGPFSDPSIGPVS